MKAKKTVSLVLIVELALAFGSLAEEGTWTTRSPMPTPRSHLSASVVDGKIYTIGGCTQAVYQEYLSTVEAYDPVTDTWTKKANMPTGRCWLSTCALNGKIYAIGGKIESSATMVSTVEEYDPVTDIWTKKADMPTARMALSANVVNGKIYAIGGVATGGGAGPSLSKVEVFDPVTNTWTQKTDMPTARANPSSGMLDGNIYVIGGSTGWSTVFSTVEVYDSETDTWTTEPDMLTARSAGPSAGVVDGKVYVLGGVLNPSNWTPTAAVEVYQPNPLVIDFNGDGIVDSVDMCMMVDYWGTDELLYDIAPPPLGDGIVDIQDLILLSEHLFEEIFPLELVAYWKLDESEGDIAYNSIGDNHGILNGNATWQPYNGNVAGAIEFDGIDDYVETDFVLNPANNPFSVFAWIQGGEPGLVIISQLDGIGMGETWLGTDTSYGKLMTGLVPIQVGRFAQLPLISESIITDGHWHHIGFIWDGSYRALYLDGEEIARDTAVQNPLKSSTGGLRIGANKTLDAGTYFSGLIDDIRIYKQALGVKEIAALAQ
jgi:N-acetylneuraminic acid mutarotase